MSSDKQDHWPRWKQRLHEIIFEADTKTGRLFDIILLWAILTSVITIMLESVPSIKAEYGEALRLSEWFFTFLFSIEYIARLVCTIKPLKYARSFFGIVDLVSIIPIFLAFIFEGSQALSVIRGLRLLRIFRVLKLARYNSEAKLIMRSVTASRQKIMVFIGSVFIISVILGTVIYLVEGGHDSGFTSIPMSVYWAIVTLTTVGYGDIAPVTPIGRALASLAMILGYGVIAVPTGIVSAEIAGAARAAYDVSTQACPSCSLEGHDMDSKHCKFCGHQL
jgi:voltage-gated potassium channel